MCVCVLTIESNQLNDVHHAFVHTLGTKPNLQENKEKMAEFELKKRKEKFCSIDNLTFRGKRNPSKEKLSFLTRHDTIRNFFFIWTHTHTHKNWMGKLHGSHSSVSQTLKQTLSCNIIYHIWFNHTHTQRKKYLWSKSVSTMVVDTSLK